MSKLKIKKLAATEPVKEKELNDSTFELSNLSDFFINPNSAYRSTGNLAKDFKFLYEAIQKRVTYKDLERRIILGLDEKITGLEEKINKLEKKLESFKEETTDNPKQ